VAPPTPSAEEAAALVQDVGADVKTRAELDREIVAENQAIRQMSRSHYRWSRVRDRIARDELIMELWEMGVSREEIAERVDLTPQRVSQIVNGFGAGWPHV
jgi:hypothetical protein